MVHVKGRAEGVADTPLGRLSPSCSGARLGPSSLNSWTAYRAARRSQSSPMVMGQMPPVGLLSGIPSLSKSSGIGERRSASMSLRNARQA
jgi:hypothetical protein